MPEVPVGDDHVTAEVSPPACSTSPDISGTQLASAVEDNGVSESRQPESLVPYSLPHDGTGKCSNPYKCSLSGLTKTQTAASSHVGTTGTAASVGEDTHLVAEAEVPNEVSALQTSINRPTPSPPRENVQIDTDRTTSSAPTAQGQESTVPLQCPDYGPGITGLVNRDAPPARHAEGPNRGSALGLLKYRPGRPRALTHLEGTMRNTGALTFPTAEAEIATVTGLHATGAEQVQEVALDSSEATATGVVQETIVTTSSHAGPSDQATAAQTQDTADENATSEGSSDAECLCVFNEYIDRATMDYLDGLSQVWSLRIQKKTFEFILSRRQMFKDAYHELSTKSRRLLCRNHVRQLAKLVGLRVEAGHELFVQRLAFTATNASTYEEFKIKVLEGRDTSHWFRNVVPIQDRPQSRYLLHPYRFKAANDTKGCLERLQQKIQANSDNILSDILSWYVEDHATIPTQDFSYVDVPMVFNWIFDNQSRRSIADIAMTEASIHRFHLKTAERPENSGNHLAFGFQFSLVQQIIEQHPLFYLLNLLLQPGTEKSMFLVSYPNPAIISASHGGSGYVFSADPRTGELAPFRAVLPIMEEGNNSCDSVLECLHGATDMRDFLQQYMSTDMEHSVAAERSVSGYRLDPDVVNTVVSAQSSQFSVAPLPIKTGSIRLLKGTVATASRGERFALQPQLVPVAHYDTVPVLCNGISLEDLQKHRVYRKPLPGHFQIACQASQLYRRRYSLTSHFMTARYLVSWNYCSPVTRIDLWRSSTIGIKRPQVYSL